MAEKPALGDEVSHETQILSYIVELFKTYSDETPGILDPSCVRASISKILPGFATGSLQDAHECLEAVLRFIDTALQTSDTPTTPSEVPVSLTHSYFGIHTVVSPSCGCGERSGRVVYTNAYYFTIWAPILIHKAFSSERSSTTFQNMLVGQHEQLTCDVCKNKVSLQTALREIKGGGFSNPKVLSINVSWSKETATREEIRKFVSSVPVTFRLVDCIECNDETCAIMTGVVFYYGLHYVSAVYNSEEKIWVIFDDSALRTVSKSIPGLWQYAVNGKLMPFMIFYRCAKKTAPAYSTLYSLFQTTQEGSTEPDVLKPNLQKEMYSWLTANTRADVDLTTPKKSPSKDPIILSQEQSEEKSDDFKMDMGREARKRKRQAGDRADSKPVDLYSIDTPVKRRRKVDNQAPPKGEFTSRAAHNLFGLKDKSTGIRIDKAAVLFEESSLRGVGETPSAPPLPSGAMNVLDVDSDLAMKTDSNLIQFLMEQPCISREYALLPPVALLSLIKQHEIMQKAALAK